MIERCHRTIWHLLVIQCIKQISLTSPHSVVDTYFITHIGSTIIVTRSGSHPPLRERAQAQARAPQ